MRSNSARRSAPVNRTPPVPDLEIPTFRAAGADPSSWIKPTDKPLVFRTTGQKKDVTLVPLNSLFDRRYSVYWQVTHPQWLEGRAARPRGAV